MATTTTKTKSAQKLHVEEEVNKRDDIKKRHESIEENIYFISVGLAQVYESAEYLGWGFPNFRSYVEFDLEPFGVSYETALKRVGNGQAIMRFNLTPENLVGVNYSVLKEIVSAITAETKKSDVDRWLNDTKGMSARDAQKYMISVKNVRDGGTTIRKTEIKLSFSNEQAEVFWSVVELAKPLVETENLSVLLEYILIEWSMSFNKNIAKEILDRIHPAPQESIKSVPKERADVAKKKTNSADKSKKES